MKLRSLALAALLVFAVTAAHGCSSKLGRGDETHFQSCDNDRDCAHLGSAFACVSHACLVPEGGSTAGAGMDDSAIATGASASKDASSGGTVAGCTSVAAGPPVDIVDPAGGQLHYAQFLATTTGMVGVWPGASSGIRVAHFDFAGSLVESATVWNGEPPAQSPSLAITGNTLAYVAQVGEGVDGRQTCHLGLLDLDTLASVQTPTRFSDAPDPDTILNEAYQCSVAALGSGFIVVWYQMVSNTSDAWKLFAQRYGADGNAVDERLTLASGGSGFKPDPISATGQASRAAIAFGNDPGATNIALVDESQTMTRTVALPSPLDLAAAHSGFVAISGSSVAILDATAASITHGPVTIDSATRVAPLGSTWVRVRRSEFLVATVLDTALGDASGDTALSTDREAALQQLVANPGGDFTAAVYNDGAGLHFSRLSCSNGPGQPVGLAACSEAGSVEPLDDGCTEAVCHAAIRLDFLTLGLRGYATVGGSTQVDAAGATAAAETALSSLEYSGTPAVSGPNAGLFRVEVPPTDFGAFALVGAESGAVVAAGGVEWSGRGNYVTPSWKEASPLACGTAKATPSSSFTDVGDCPDSDGQAIGATPDAALELALRTNIARYYDANGPFSVYVYLYTPTVGACDPNVAEYVVVFTRHRS